MSTVGASLFEEIHCGYRDGQLCLHRDQEGWRGEAEGEEEGEETASKDELQVGSIPPPPPPLFTLQPSLSLTSDEELGGKCYVHPCSPQGNNDELNLWPLSVIGQQRIDLQSFHL